MRAFVTGATGFIGGHVARQLRERGDDVVALVRSPEKASDLRELGCELVEGDLTSVDAIREGVEGAGAVFHVAAVYKVGIPRSEHEAMYDSNVRGTERVLDAAIDASVPKIVYVSTVGAFGNTHGEVVDETYEHPGENFTSYYEETKVLAHRVAVDRIGKGAPIVIVQPAGVYGPNDHSELGNMIDQTRTGKMRLSLFPDSGFCFVHVEDVAAGILLAHDKGKVGEAYVLAGERGTLGELVRKTAKLSDRKPPRLKMPSLLMKAAIPVGPVVGKAMGFPPNLRELISSTDGVTFWASDAKARRDLGFEPRDLETGLKQTLAASS